MLASGRGGREALPKPAGHRHAGAGLVEVKLADERLHPDLARYQEALGAAHAFQAVLEMPYEDVDVFTERRPVVVPARTLLSQVF
jgi:hypothetical protein